MILLVLLLMIINYTSSKYYLQLICFNFPTERFNFAFLVAEMRLQTLVISAKDSKYHITKLTFVRYIVI